MSNGVSGSCVWGLSAELAVSTSATSIYFSELGQPLAGQWFQRQPGTYLIQQVDQILSTLSFLALVTGDHDPDIIAVNTGCTKDDIRTALFLALRLARMTGLFSTAA